jgi:hypothetical protein
LILNCTEFKLFHLAGLKRGNNQQNGIGAHRSGLIDLIGINDEILANHW